jgi:16S rRNA (guanine966-N2)-methyltransferase
MRIIAGKLGGRLFDSPSTHRTHPMSDKARGALFNILGDIEGMSVLDPFAGTGALSLEAISRGAVTALAIESDRPAQRIIEQNVRSLGLQSAVQLVQATANAWLQTNHDDLFDLVLCDPPYNDLQQNLIVRLAGRVISGGILVLSWPANQEAPAFNNLDKIDQRSYGDMQLIFYRRQIF